MTAFWELPYGMVEVGERAIMRDNLAGHIGIG